MGNQIIQLDPDESFKTEEYVVKMGIKQVTFTNNYLQNIKVFNDYLTKSNQLIKDLFIDEEEHSEDEISSDTDLSATWVSNLEANKQIINQFSFTNPKFKINISKDLKTREEIKVMLSNEIEK